MFIFVLTCNSLIVIFNCYLLWQILTIKKNLTQLANTLENLEKSLPLTLQLMELNARRSEYQSLTLRKKYEVLQQKWETLFMLVQFLKWLYRKYHSWGWRQIDNREVIGDNRAQLIKLGVKIAIHLTNPCSNQTLVLIKIKRLKRGHEQNRIKKIWLVSYK